MAEEYVVGARKEDKARIAREDAPEMKSWGDILTHTHIGDLLPPSYAIYDVKKDQPVKDALQVMSERNILSVPLYDPKTDMHVAFVDMIDLVAFLVDTVTEQELRNGPATAFLSEKLKHVTCSQVANSSKRNPFKPVETGASLKIAMKILAESGAHRLPVIDSNGKLITVLSESSVLSYLAPHLSKSKCSGATVEEINLGLKQVANISLESSLKDAFLILRERQVSALAVVDSRGRLVGNLSATNLKHIGSNFSRLYDTVGEFLKQLPQNPSIPGPICVNSKATVEEVTTKLVETRVHRCYVIDAEEVPIGVISLHDLITLLSY